MLYEKRSLIWILAFLLCLLTPAGCQRIGEARATLRVTFLDVGQGDSIVIESPTGRVVVVDGGGIPGTDERMGRDPGNYVVVPYLRSRGISTVDLLVPTHPDEDHVQGLNAVVARLTVRAALDGGYPGFSPSYRRLMESLRRRNIPIYQARRGQKAIAIGGGAYLEIFGPGNQPLRGGHSETNDNSVVLRVVYGKARILLTGDAEEREENAIAATVSDITADVLKAGHHGSRYSTSDAFLSRVRPSLAILSCGADNVYGHPHREILDRLQRHNVRILRTDRDGAIIVETDGTNLKALGAGQPRK